MTSDQCSPRLGTSQQFWTNLEARDVLFIDEIHRLNPVVEEVLYPALDFELDLVIGEGPLHALCASNCNPLLWLVRQHGSVF